MSDNGCLDLQTDDEKKSKKKQPSPVDDRPTVPAPSEAMLNSKFLVLLITHSILSLRVVC